MAAGQCLLIDSAPAGIATNVSKARVFGVALNAPTTDTITLTGVSNIDGTAASWTIGPGQSGFQAAPGSQTAWGGLRYSLADPADLGKAILCWQAL